MPTKTKMTSFFAGNRREMVLSEYRVLQTKADEKRIKAAIEMPISNRSVVAMPEWISEPYIVMEKENSLTARSNIEALLEGFTIDMFTTDTIRTKMLTATSVTMGGFYLLNEGEGEKKETTLHFNLYVPGSIQLRDWCWEFLRKTFYAELEYSQTEMEFGGADDEKPEDEEDEPVAASAVNEAQMSLNGADHDAEFASPKDAKVVARRLRGFEKSTGQGAN